MQQFEKRLLALLMVICAVIGFLPATALPTAAATETKVIGQQLNLGDDLTMRFYVSVEDAYVETAVMNVASCGESADYAIKDETPNSDGNYVFTVDLSAAEMTEDITLTLTSGQNQLLQEVYSVQEYAHYLLENNYTTETKNLVREMLNYGAKAQQYFDYKTDDLANAGYVLDETERTITDSAPSVTPSGSISGVTLHGCTMIFENRIAVRAYFAAPNGMDGCTVTVGGQKVDVHKKGSYYYIEVGDIYPNQMDIVLPISVSKDDETLSFSYSPMYYITRMYNKDNTNAGLKALVLAAKYYFDAAKVFTGIKQTHTGELTLANRYGTDSLIQVNTNLAADIPCVHFTASQNGCNIDQSANLYQQVGWIEMANVDGTIVLTFRFNAPFEAGQTYVLPKGAVFGFTDGSRYTLDKHYTFTFDGSGWTMEAKEDPITLAYRYGTSSLIQFNTNLPVSETNGDFTAAENGCTFIENGDTRVGWVGTANVNGTVVLTFNLSAAAAIGQSYNLGKGSVFVLDDGSRYQLEQDITLYWDGSKWIETVPVFPELSFNQYRYGTSTLIQVNTNLPSSTACDNFLAGANGCNITQGGDQLVGWIGMENVSGTIVLTFHFNNAFTAGQTYVLPKGAVFGFTDGSRYTLDKHYTFTFDGSGWSMEAKEDPVTLVYRWGNSNTIQFNTDLPATTPLQDFLAADNGCQLTQGGDQQVGYVSMLNADGTIVLTFNFNSAFTFGQKYTLSAGSVFGFEDGSKYSLTETLTLYFDGSEWVTEEPTDVLDPGNFEGGVDIITFADMPVDGNDATKLQEYVDLGFNTSLLAEDHTGALGPDELYRVDSPNMTHILGTLTFQYRYGAANVLQVNTNLPVTTPVGNFTAGSNGCIIDQSGNQYQQVGWIQMHDPSETGGIMVLTFHFNNNFEAGQTYVLPAGAIFGFTDGNKYTLDGDYTFTFDGSNWSMSCERPLTLSLNSADYDTIQLKTNIPTGLTYGNFLLGDTSGGHNVILETTEGAKSVAWFSYGELSGAVYFTFEFNGQYQKPGTQYILKAGTTLKAGDNYYTLQQDYVMTYRNIYLESLEKLDAAGLNVWIRNYHNTADYFSENMTKALKLYQDKIDGFYMADEAFQTQALQSASGQTATTNFEDMVTLRDWFNTNFATKYFHANHVPITSYDHYSSTTGSTLSDWDTASYKNFLAGYESGILDALTTPSGASIGFDSYPFIHAQGGHGGFWGIGETWESGIQKTFLVSALTAAQVAKETGRDFSMCIQTFEAIDQEYKNTSRDIERASEVALQLYTGMAMGVDIFEYFAYNSSDDFYGIMDLEGNKRIYDIVKEGNQALCFQDVVNTFTWDGIMTCAGTNNNEVGFGYVSGMVLSDSNNGVLSSVTSAHDAIIGCFTKDDLNGYMVVNFEDPAAVTGNNTVALTFDGCSRARVYTQTGGVLSSQVVNLTDGTYTATLAPGSACFVIPA